MGNAFTTTSATVDSSALTTLAKCKEYMGITSSDDDTKISNLLLAASRATETYCDRLFIETSRTEYHKGHGRRYLNLEAYPFQDNGAITLCAADDVVLQVTNSSASNAWARIAVGATTTSLSYSWQTITGTVTGPTTPTYAASTLLSSLATTITALGSGWSASAVGTYGYYTAGYLKLNQGPLNAKDNVAELRAFVVDLLPDLNPDAGTLWFGQRHLCGTVKVIYTAGYTTIPDDVQEACCALVAAMFRVSTTDQTLKKERLGDYSYELVDAKSLSDSLPALSTDAALLLAPYRRPHIL